mmetsp:Transcript_28454/g.60341  ORF Transcript_28454/g.60341 Transcript_28454/m.60341 type:complete len:272 (-) Transcript_28454:36-851(-)
MSWGQRPTNQRYAPMQPYPEDQLPNPQGGRAQEQWERNLAEGVCCVPESGGGVQFMGLVPSESMELSNDPRFFNDNVIDKRLTAFTALSVVSSLMAGAACDQFFPFLEKDMKMWGSETPVRGFMQLFGFVLMCLVLFLNILATMVFGVQFYFTYRLMTSGPIGFESARSFYLDQNMTYYRQLSAKGLIWGLPMFVLSVGCMLFVKFDDANSERKVTAWCTFATFLAFAVCLFRVGLKHQMVFDSKYRYTGAGVRPLLTEMDSSAPRTNRYP